VTNSDEQAIEMVNATEFGSIASVYSADLKRAIKVDESLKSGIVAINKGAISNPVVPFGGFK
jgi:succinate-semialdehyde dehydrogenase/glutarate-semialdehyde dehydrogenase